MEELKEFIEEAEEEENLLTTAPISEVDIHEMSKEELKDFVMEAVIETKLLEPIVIPIREAQLVQMSKYVKAKQFVEGRCNFIAKRCFERKGILVCVSKVALQGGAEGADHGNAGTD